MHLLCKRKKMIKGLFISLFFIAFQLNGQPECRLYAFAESHTKGIVRQREPGNNKPVNAITEYYFYLACPATKVLKTTELWIKGNRHFIKNTKTVSSPVVTRNNKILVPASNLKITQITAGNQYDNRLKPSSWLRRTVNENELVVVYTCQGKKYIRSVKKITKLDTVFGE